MGEIKMNDPDLREIASALRYLEGREEECSSNRRKWGEIATAIEEQVKPAVEEPIEFGSIVRAGYDAHTDRVLWVRCPDGWHAEVGQGYHAFFVGLHDPEVLRVGLGGEPLTQEVEQAERKAFAEGDYAGTRETVRKIHGSLQLLLAEAITSERKNAYEKAIQAVEELAP